MYCLCYLNCLSCYLYLSRNNFRKKRCFVLSKEFAEKVLYFNHFPFNKLYLRWHSKKRGNERHLNIKMTAALPLVFIIKLRLIDRGPPAAVALHILSFRYLYNFFLGLSLFKFRAIPCRVISLFASSSVVVD